MDVPILGVFWKLLGIVLPWLGGKQARRRAFIAQRVGSIEGFLNTTDEYLGLLEGHAVRQGALGAGRVERVQDLCREMSHALLPNYLASHSAVEAIADEKLSAAFREAERMGGAVRGFAQVVSEEFPARFLGEIVGDSREAVRQARRRIRELLI